MTRILESAPGSGFTFLRISTDPRTGRKRCEVAGDSQDKSEAYDCRGIVADLWSNYSREVLIRFENAFTPAVLGGCELPGEVLEHQVLTEIYRPRAFPALLAGMLHSDFVQRFDCGSRQDFIFMLPPCAGDPLALARLMERHFHDRSADPPSIRNLICNVTAATAFALGVATAFFGVLRLGVTSWRRGRVSRSPLAENLFVVFPGEGAHTRHIWEEIRLATDGAPSPDILVLGHKSLEGHLVKLIEGKGGRVIHLMQVKGLAPAVGSLSRCWRHLLRSHRIAEQDLGLRLGLEFHTRAGAWFLRGLMHETFLRTIKLANPETTLAVFGLIAHADSRLADFALRMRGVTTFHWLHGVVEDGLHYRANSSVCLCQNPVDTDLRQRHGAYGNCRMIPAGIPAEAASETYSPVPDTRSGALVITNLIHPDNRFAAYGAAWSLEQLLRMTAECSRSMGIAQITWRPHPKESESPEFRKYKRLAQNLGFSVDNSTPLRHQIKSHRHVITTFSGSIGDVAAAGAIPAIYAGLPYETEGHWGRLPAALKFRTAKQLAAVLANFSDLAWVTGQRRALLTQYNQPRQNPAEASRLLEQLHAVRQAAARG